MSVCERRYSSEYIARDTSAYAADARRWGGAFVLPICSNLVVTTVHVSRVLVSTISSGNLH